jgi:hypothetical protein
MIPPDLAEGLGPEPVVPPRELVSSWSLRSMTGYLEALDARQAWHAGMRAAQRQRDGASHFDVMMALAGAEMRALPADRPAYAARLDAYASHYGLRGWYRYTMRCAGGKHAVQVNKLRTPEDGEAGRYFASSTPLGRPHVVDRDTGRIVARDFADSKAAQGWITRAERPVEPIPMPYPCCEHCRHPRHPQFTGHPSPCYHCELARLAAHLRATGEIPPGCAPE